jgi:hypothetical protein
MATSIFEGVVPPPGLSTDEGGGFAPVFDQTQMRRFCTARLTQNRANLVGF